MSNICVDLDDVMFDWLGDFLPFMKKRCLDKSWKVSNKNRRSWTIWNGYESFGLNRDQFIEIYKEYCQRGRFAYLKPLPDVRKLKNIVKELGFPQVIFVTVRPPSTIFQTINALDNLGFVGYNLIHIGRDSILEQQSLIWDGKEVKPCNILSKKMAFEIYKPILVADDRAEYVQDAIDVGVKNSVLFKRNWNSKSTLIDNPFCIKVDNWRQLEKNMWRIKC